MGNYFLEKMNTKLPPIKIRRSMIMKLSLRPYQIMTEAQEINPVLGNIRGRPEFADGLHQCIKYYSWSREDISWIYCMVVLTVIRRPVSRRARSMVQRIPWVTFLIVGGAWSGTPLFRC